MTLRRCLLLAAVALGALSGCGEPTCPPSAVKLPGGADELSWTDDGPSFVVGKVGDRSLHLLLDTGFSQSAFSPDAAQGLNLRQLELDLGATHVGPMVAGLFTANIGVDGVIGAETLHQLPMILDARARTTKILAAFEPVDPNGAPLTVVAPEVCRDGTPQAGPAGPFAFLVHGDIEGMPVTFILDTGAGGTFVRTSVLETLTGRAKVSNVDVGSGFDGNFTGEATRTKLLKVGNAESPNALLVAAPEIDRELDRQSELLNSSKQAGITEELHVDGYLGWTFLREFKVSLANGSPAGPRALGLERFDTQDHWQREFEGIGLYRSPSADPAGIRVDGFLDPSPAKDAGLLKGDVIVKVDGQDVQGDSAIVFHSQSATFDVLRRENGAWVQKQFTVTWADLLPDPQ